MTYRSYRNYLLASLIVLYAFNYVDLLALGMALPGIKADLHLTDTELGVLSGMAFWLFYAALGVPMGQWADRGNRVTILFVTRILWSVFVILTGRARSFLHLLVLRAAAAVGESGCVPPSYSLISDYFSRDARPRALGFFFLGNPCAAIIGFFGAGWLMQLYGWRVMFTIIGLPGILLAVLTLLTLKEPRKGPAAERRPGTEADPATGQPSFWQTLRLLYVNTTYRNLLLTLVINYFFSANTQWQAVYFTREYGLSSGTLGTWLAVIYGIPQLVGNVLGGIIASRWAQRNEQSHLVGVAGLYCVVAVTLTTVYLTHDYHVAFALIGLATALFGLMQGPLFGALQTVVPPGLRAISLTIVLFFATFVGTGLGPLFVGVTSDLLRPLLGVESLRCALSVTGPWLLFSGWFAWRASKSVALDAETHTERAEASDADALGTDAPPCCRN